MEILEQLPEIVLTEQDLKSALIIFGIYFVVFFLLGFFDRVTIYTDYRDVCWGGSIVVSPILMVMSLSWLAPDPIPNEYNLFWDTNQARIITIVFLIITAAGAIMTLVNSVTTNGVVIGFIVWIFKIACSAIVVLSLVGMFNALTDKKRKIGTIFLVVIVFGIFSFLLRGLVNGERVKARRTSPP